MEIPELVIIITSIIVCIASIASTSIGIYAYNKNAAWKQQHYHSFNFLVTNLVIAVIILILSLTALGLYIHSKIN